MTDSQQILLVPYENRDEARLLGGRWDAETKVWTIEPDKVANLPRSMLPLRDRPGLSPPFIRINLIPQTSWGRNLRAVMPKEDWREFVRSHVYASTGQRCLVCGGRGPEWPVEADEVWRFNDITYVQKLIAIVPICPACHEVRSMGHAISNGRRSQATQHLAWVNRTDVTDERKVVDQAMAIWQKRSQHQWSIDISLMRDRYGMSIKWDEGLAQIVNKELVQDARQRYLQQDRKPFGAFRG